jgi:hypothetical protein
LSTDWYTRLVLAVIAVCLGLLVVQGYRDGDGAAGPEEDRYRLTPLPIARMVLRFDAETGKTWKSMFPDLNIWTPIADSPAELLEQAIAETPEAPAPEAETPEAPAPEAAAPEALKDPEAGASEDAVTP